MPGSSPAMTTSRGSCRDHGTFSSAGGSKPFAPPPPEVVEVLAQVPDPQQMDLLTSDPPRHQRLRRFMQDAFTLKRVAGLEDGLRALAHELVDDVEADGTCDFYTTFAHPFPLRAIGQLIGIPRADQGRITHWVTCNIQLKWGSLDAESHLAAARGRVEFYEFGQRLIAERRAEPGDDLLSALVTESDASDDPLTEPELVGQIMTLLTAGHETTANWLTLAVRRLLDEPGRWAGLASDVESLGAVVEETLRYDGPAQGLWRTARDDVEVGGVTVPKGRGSRPSWARRVAMATCSLNPTASISTGPTPELTCSSVVASTRASAPAWPGSRGVLRSRCFASASRAFACATAAPLSSLRTPSSGCPAGCSSSGMSSRD